jgi:LPXTG-motif cell wall-anchored protein
MRGHTPKPVTGHRRAFAALVSTAALAAALTASGPAFAQDQAAPPVAPTVAQPAPAAPVQAVPAPQAAAPAAPTFAAPSPVVQPIDPSKTGPAQITDAASAAERPAAVAAPAPKPAAPAPAPAPEAAAPAPVAAAPVVAPAKPAVDTAAKSTTTRQTTTDTPSAPIWPWLVAAGLIVLGIAGFLFSRRRRNDAVYTDDYAEPAYAAPVAVEPVYAAVPAVVDAQMTDPFVETPQPVEADIAVAPTQAELTAPESEDVAALTDAAAPVANRPWLEFAMRPISASTNADEAMVEIELTIGNSGSIAAEDVQISTFMFPAGHADATEMERLLLERGPRDGVTIEPGEGTRLDATLSVLRSSLEGDFQPVIVADARYRLPDGSEGRTAASFSIGLSDGGGISPIPTEDKGRHEDIAAVLYGEPEHA